MVIDDGDADGYDAAEDRRINQGTVLDRYM